MAFDWWDYFTLAQHLQTYTPLGVTEEAARRCAVGRAYFAAFGFAFRYATDYLGFVPRDNADDHGRLKAHFRTSRREGVSRRLDRLRGWRNQCDYDSETGDLVLMLDKALEDALFVFDALPPPATP